MTRRKLVTTAGGVALASASASAAEQKPMILQLTKLRLRNTADNQGARCREFLAKSFLPAAQRAGIGPLGFFSSMVGPDTPYLLVLAGYASLAAMETASAKVAANSEYMTALEAFDAQPGLNYVRMERSLLRAFDAMPSIEIPPGDAKRPGRVFELRTYESNSSSSLKKKIKMFADGEIAIFRKSGLMPVFFGENAFVRDHSGFGILVTHRRLLKYRRGPARMGVTVGVDCSQLDWKLAF